LPAIYDAREFVQSGGLISYGPSLLAMQQRVAEYVDKIFKGAKPGDLPVEQPTKFELVINLKAAKALVAAGGVPSQLRTFFLEAGTLNSAPLHRRKHHRSAGEELLPVSLHKSGHHGLSGSCLLLTQSRHYAKNRLAPKCSKTLLRFSVQTCVGGGRSAFAASTKGIYSRHRRPARSCKVVVGSTQKGSELASYRSARVNPISASMRSSRSARCARSRRCLMAMAIPQTRCANPETNLSIDVYGTFAVTARPPFAKYEP
jgi:hypothetical protein